MVGAARVYPPMTCTQVFVQQSSARRSVHRDSMTYAHLVPRARACAVAGACLLQKPWNFLVFYKYKPHPLFNKSKRSHNLIKNFYASTLLPKSNSSTDTTDPPIDMPTYIVSLNHCKLHRIRSCLEITSCV